MTRLALVVALVAGCSPSRDDTTAEDLGDDSAASLTGTSVSLNGVSLNGVSLDGASLDGVWLDGTSLTGTVGGTSLRGTDFIGAHLQGLVADGTTVELQIEAIAPLDAPNADVLGYVVSAAADGGWTALCGPAADGSPMLAIPVAGVWDEATGAWSDYPGAFSLACRHASIARCVELGYKSWNGHADHHHACVRMLRADYCGDGVPHTISGTPINSYDDVGIQADTEVWPVDAEWTPDGASCVNHYRGGAAPPCYTQKYSASCGSFATGALLIDEFDEQ